LNIPAIAQVYPPPGRTEIRVVLETSNNNLRTL